MKTQFLLLAIITALQLGCSTNANNGFTSSNNSNNNGTVVPLGCNRHSGNKLSVRLNADLLNSQYVYVTFLSSPSEFSSQNAMIKFLVGNESTINTYVGFTVRYGSQQISGWNPPPNSFVTQSFLNALNNNQTLQITALNFHVNVGPSTNPILKIVLEGSSNNVIEDVNMLIPSFDANPNTYAQNHSNALLNIHPLLSYKSQNWTSDQFRQQGEFICNQ